MSVSFKTFEDLEFTDDFIFGKIMHNPEICAEIIERLLKIRVSRIDYPELQKEIRPYYTSKGIRMDVYLKDSDKIFDIEMQSQRIDELPKRMRYYQSILDVNDLMRGADYSELRESFIIFICKNRPFIDSNLPVYDFKLYTNSEPKILLDDKTHRLIYNASAYEQETDLKLKAFLQFVCSGDSKDDFTDYLSDLVKSLKQNEANKTEYGNMNLHDRDIKMAGKKEGAIEAAIKLFNQNVGTLSQISTWLNIPLQDLQEALQDNSKPAD